MRTHTRALVALAAASLAVPLWAVPASAETVAETASIGAYYLSTNPGTVGAVPQNPLGGQKAPDTAKNADGVAQDDLAVAVTAAGSGMPDKFSALQWDLLDLGFEATVSKATVVLPFSTKPDSRSTDRNAGLVVGCLGGPEGFGDADGEPFQDAPSQTCAETAVPATAVEGGNALEFDITAIAQKWTELNTGLILYPSEAGFAKPFQSVFADKSQARLTLAFTAPAVEEFVDDPELTELPSDVSAPEETFDSTAVDSTAVDSGGFDSGGFDSGGVDSGGFDSGGFDSGTGSVDSGSASFGSTLDTPSLASPDAPSPDVAAELLAAGPRQAVRTASAGNPMALDGLTVIALLAGAALLAVVSLALGAPAVAASGARQAIRQGGVASALARRRAATPSFGPRSV
jgi:uncharacterized membrane protein YgcG